MLGLFENSAVQNCTDTPDVCTGPRACLIIFLDCLVNRVVFLGVRGVLSSLFYRNVCNSAYVHSLGCLYIGF